MQTPDTKAGRITEEVMAEISRTAGQIPTGIYNPVYSAVLRVMMKEFPEQPGEAAHPGEMRFIDSEIARNVLGSR